MNKTNPQYLTGTLAIAWKPFRDSRSKYYLPFDVFPDPVLPTFIAGPAYLVSSDAFTRIYSTSVTLTPLFLEDVYMTGIVAQNASVNRIDNKQIHNIRVRVNRFTFKNMINSHGYSPN